MAFKDHDDAPKHLTTWTTAEVVSYCKTHLNDPKALAKIGLGPKDAKTYINLYGGK